MDETTIRSLNDLNRRFYSKFADSFDATRGSAWAGWERSAGHLRPDLHILDVGCGNGRFGVYLAERFSAEHLHYHGIDYSEALLERARIALNAVPVVLLEARDLLVDPLPASQYDCVALFGVLHHIPGAERRLAMLKALSERVAPGGILMFTEWRFHEYPRFRERIIPWNEPHKVESGDYLLDWQHDKTTPRYCHHVDDDEHDRLIASLPLTVIDDYRADGADGRLNRYTVLRA